MAFSGVLPKVVSDVGPGGPMITNALGVNKLTASNLENQFKPLEMAVKAQNALSYNNRMGNVGLFLRGIAQMPSAERQAYLANPENRQNYMNMLESFRSGINNPGANGNVLTPEFVQNSLSRTQGNPIQNLLGTLVNKLGGGNSNQNPMAMSNMQQGQSQNAFAQQGGAGAMSGGNSVSGQELGNVGNVPDSGYVSNDEPVNQQDELNAANGTEGRMQNPEANIPVSPKLSQAQRDVYGSQLQSNNQHIGTQLKNRADAAIAFDKFLQSHKPDIQKVFTDAAKYNQLYGRGKNWLDKFKNDQPEEYANYITAKNSLTPLMANGIRFLEAMGVSHDAQEDARNQVSTAIDRLDVAPETALKVFNNHMSALNDVSEGILSSAEPVYPGVRRKLAGVQEFKGDFIPINKVKASEKKSSSKLSAPQGKVSVRNKETGQTGYIPADRLEAYESNGYERI